jgi:hypothetical protein
VHDEEGDDGGEQIPWEGSVSERGERGVLDDSHKPLKPERRRERLWDRPTEVSKRYEM